MKRTAIASCVLTAGVVALAWALTRGSTGNELRQIRRLVATDPKAALERATELLNQDPLDNQRLELLAVAAEAARRPDVLADVLSQSSLPEAVRLPLLQRLSRLALSTGRLTIAETALRKALQSAPDNTDLRRDLANLLLAECRRWESRTELYQLVRGSSFLLDELAMLGSTEELLDDQELLNRASSDRTDQRIVTVARARLAAYSGDHVSAIRQLQSLLSTVEPTEPDSAELLATLGRSLVAVGDVAALQTWNVAASSQADSHPDVLYCRGWLWAQLGRNAESARHLAAAIRIDPNHRLALQQLGTMLAADGQTAAAGPLLERARLLDELERLLHRILVDDQQLNSMQRAAELTAALGRPMETWAWHLAIAGYHPQVAPQFRELAAQWQVLADAEPSQTSLQTIAQIESCLVDLQLKDSRSPADLLTGASGKSSGLSQLRFRDVADHVGLQTPYFSGLPEDLRGLFIYQGFGGGVAVVDIDADDKPDLHFTHGNTWPLSTDPRSRDRLLVQRGGQFVDLSDVALPPDRDFGQGVACGDFNNDGFDDLYVANIGVNVLLLNNGDGTMTRAVLPELQSLPKWSTSCAIADLTMDGQPDLFHTSYAGGDVFTRTCLSGAQQIPRSCRPDLFVGTPDTLLISDGAGQVQRAGTDVLPVDSGRGLGVVIGDFEGTGRLEAFISNDMTPNALLKSVGDPVGSVRFEDQATLRGAATNGAGRIQAGMGIAAGDLTGDGLTDFFVTNFLEETNTLYASQPGGFYSDMSARSGADTGSLAMLSFGVQPLDADVDGDLDLVLLNGHVDDYTHMQAPWKMPPAAYEQTGTGEFTLLPADALSAYGSQPALGRALARLDWNRDGRDDLVATHLDRPPALLQNESMPVGSRLELVLKGRKSCRTPFGAIIRASFRTQNGSLREAVSQLLAGDGYYCSNERCISFAVRPGEVVDSLTIRWPSGQQQSLTAPPSAGRFLVVEQSAQVHELPRSK